MTPTSGLRPRERVLMAIGHEQLDRVPFVIGVDNTTGVQYRAYRRLQAALGLSGEVRPLHGTWWELGTAQMAEDVLRALGSDARGVWDRKPRHVEGRNLRRPPGDP